MQLQFYSETYDSKQDPRRFRAPSGKMFRVRSYTLSNFASAATRFVVSSAVPEEDLLLSTDNNAFIVIDVGSDGLFASHTFDGDGLLMKEITMGVQGSANVDLTIIIFYELVEATQSQLIWEFIRRGKQP